MRKRQQRPDISRASLAEVAQTTANFFQAMAKSLQESAGESTSLSMSESPSSAQIWQPTFRAETGSPSRSGSSESSEAFLVQIVLPNSQEAETAANLLRERGGQPVTQKITIPSGS